MDYDTYIILGITFFPTLATLAFIFSLLTYTQGERARHQTTRRIRDIEAEFINLLEHVLKVNDLVQRTQVQHVRPTERRYHRSIAHSNTHPAHRSRIPCPLSRSSTLSYAHSTRLILELNLALRALVHPALTNRQITQLIVDFGDNIQYLQNRGEVDEVNVLDIRIVYQILNALWITLTHAETVISPWQIVDILNRFRGLMREMCSDNDDADSTQGNSPGSYSPPQLSPTPSNLSGNTPMESSLSGDTLVHSESSDGEDGPLVGRHYRPARFEFGGGGEDRLAEDSMYS
jgi:hypothetical protein